MSLVLVVVGLVLVAAGLTALLHRSDRGAAETIVLESTRYDPLFDSYLDQPVGWDAEWVALADINGDGHLDQLVAAQIGGHVAFLAGYGDGGFAPARFLEVGPLPTCISVEDFDGDGLLDMAVATTGDGKLGIWLGDGEGGFRRHQRVQVFTESRELYEDEEAWFSVDRVFAIEIVRAGDVTLDGKLDLVVGRAIFPNTMGTVRDLGKGVAVLAGRGDGSFDDPVLLDTGGNAVGLALADLDEDGGLDLVVSHRLRGEVVAFRSLGGGEFERTSTVAVDDQPVYLQEGDLNGDGHQDMVVLQRTGDDITVLQGMGDGSLRHATTLQAGPVPESVAIADLDGDRVPDLSVANGGSPALLGLYRGLGEFRFEEVEEFPAGHCTNHTAIGDLDEDGLLDVVMANSSSMTTSFYKGLGRDGILGPYVHRLGADSIAGAMLDLDQDGELEVVLAHPGDQSLSILGGADRTWPTRRVRIALGGAPHDLLVLDPQGSEPPMVVVSLPARGALALVRIDDSGQPVLEPVDLAGMEPLALASGDLDGDGADEVVVFDGRASTLVVLTNQGAGPLQPLAARVALPSRTSDIIVEDLDGNGTEEVLVTLQAEDRVLVLSGGVDGPLEQVLSLDTGSEPVALTLSDLDGDGSAELITANIRGNSISVARAGPDAHFERALTWAACRHPTSLEVADVDGDQKVDVAVSCLTGNSVALMLGDGKGGFRERHIYGSDFEPRVVLLRDLDADGRIDLLSAAGAYGFDRTRAPPPANHGAKTVSVLWGRPPSSR